ncbi:PTS system fructose-specific IIC component [Pullulanibacillus pueri]|uniref:PTS system fructose-specific EIIABC component n=1 Tax=Pullulanibacillus pueri TaxID=1437324 RepID=A0A8J2ZU05_9BACL|nr:PTS fructose transporter subunit IIABC [Pullulanibacillus pueri]MBM7681366.1 PTS system fructose-specific IIC component [Pullulanibacillus pueri]GGH78598.1 PTS system fructose-specific EIIABC component [Pullulanibacillus pueri]
MKITDLLKRDTVILDLTSTSKSSVIEELVAKLDEAGRLKDKALYKEEILKREAQSTTGIGEGIAIPHAKTKAVKTPALVFGRSRQGIDYDALDGRPSHLFFMIAASEGANSDHLETLSRLSTLLMDASFREHLMTLESEEAILAAIDAKEKAEIAEEPEGSDTQNSEGMILAVTACPTGIAHTYMAADALKAKAKALNIDFKVETNGSTGVKNRLTADEIENATAIIVAADKQVEMERFKGKRVIQVPVAQGLRDPEGLLKRAMTQDAPIYQGTGKSPDEQPGGKGERTGFYKHLMNGVSNMLPLVVGGGILIALSFLFGGIKAYDPDDPSYNVIAGALHSIGADHAFALMIPVLAGFIAMSIADRPGLAPGLVGGFLASTTGAGFLGGLIAGFLAGYVVVLLKKAFAKLPESLEGIKPVLLYPFFGILITGVVMYLLGDPLQWIMNELTHWLEGLGTGNLVVLGLILGGMMSIDMGGPINKAAFTFGIAMIDAGNYAPHAAIMAGGMVPPLGLALATTLFKNRFTKQERDSGKTCYVMGATFITEGAIPFAAADPLRVIPSCVIGSSVAGALAMVFKIGLPAPHGGIFVIPFVQGHWYLYIIAIVIGSLITALLVGFLKKPIKIKAE